MSAVEELERDIDCVVVATVGLDREFCHRGDVTDHGGVAAFLADFVGEFVPDVEPVTVLFVNLGAADFEEVVGDHGVAEVGDPRPFRLEVV